METLLYIYLHLSLKPVVLLIEVNHCKITIPGDGCKLVDDVGMRGNRL